VKDLIQKFFQDSNFSSAETFHDAQRHLLKGIHKTSIQLNILELAIG
jgi:hypothetical protein